MHCCALHGLQAIAAATLVGLAAGPLWAETDGRSGDDGVVVSASDPLLVVEPLLVDPAAAEPPPVAGHGDLTATTAVAVAAPVNPYAAVVWDESPEAAHAMAPAGAPEEIGEASWYGAYFHGRTTASGEIYDMHASTVAHPTWPLGAVIRIQNLRNGRSTLARVTDRGPYAYGRILDCSYAIAEMLGFLHAGSTDVKITLLDADRNAWKRFDRRLAPARGAAPQRKRFGPPAPVEVAVALTAVEDAAPPVPVIVTGATTPPDERLALRAASVSPFPALVHTWQSVSRWFRGSAQQPSEWPGIERRLDRFGLRQLAAWLITGR